MLRKWTVLLLVFLLMISMSACQTSAPAEEEQPLIAPEEEEASVEAPEQTKIALILPGHINDAGWNAAAYNGLMEAETLFGLEVAYTESVSLVDQETTIRDYANRGYNLILCHGNEFEDAVAIVAEEFPDTYFAISNSGIRLDNAVGMFVQNEEQGYIAGYALGLLTQANQVGFVGSVEGVAQKKTEAGFLEGVKAANSSAEAIVAYTGSGDDAALGKETALSMFDRGVDAIFQYAQGSGIGVIQAAHEKNVPVVVTSVSQKEIAPDMTVLSVMSNMKVNIVSAVEAYVDGRFNKDLYIVGSFASGLYQVSEINEMMFTEEQLQMLNDTIEALKNGEISF